MFKERKEYEFVVVGGGLSGVCAAIAAARHGIKTALIQNRSVLGGNASSEICVNINGAGRADGFKNAIESGIILELLMENRKNNPHSSHHVQDMVFWKKTNFQENLDLYLNTHMFDVKMNGDKIEEITCVQTNTETEYTFAAKIFADTTGDATLADLAGADWTMGREGKKVYGESLAPDQSDKNTMGSTILFSTKELDRPVPFKKPEWAYEINEEILGERRLTNFDHGYWWVELGDAEISTIKDGEFIHSELIKYIYGLFDYMKNSGKFPLDNYVLNRIGSLPGKRESRRVYGDYVLTQNDVEKATRFEDAVAYGGWTMDDHSVGGIRAKIDRSKKQEGTIWHPIDDIYTIPYRCVYSRNIDNLYVGGRAISASHMALSSTRVMATCAVIGQAIGTAAVFAVNNDMTPRQVGEKYITQLQQTLINDDCYIPGIKDRGLGDMTTNNISSVTASSEIVGGEAHNINGDYARRIDDKNYGWISDSTDEEMWIKIDLKEAKTVDEVLIRFDPNFSKLMITTVGARHRGDFLELPKELVKDYDVHLYKDNKEIYVCSVKDNYQRVNKLKLEHRLECDSVKVCVKSTYGDKHARIFNIRLYLQGKE